MNHKENRIPEPLLQGINEFISVRMGLHFPEGRKRDLDRSLCLAAQEFGFNDPEAFARWLISTPLGKSQIEVLAGHLTVGETYFFRDRKCFDFLEERVLPEMIARRSQGGRTLRVWSAGCCTGEEPFSMAILLDKFLSCQGDWKITILATDINPVFIGKASAGTYGEWSFRDGSRRISERFFARAEGNRYRILDRIKERVTFQCHNLAEDDYPSHLNGTDSMDLILCRNVLMYLTPAHQGHVIGRFRRCLVEGGWLIVSPSEAYDPLFSGFTGVHFRGARFYRKGPERSEREGRTDGDQGDFWKAAQQWYAGTRSLDVPLPRMPLQAPAADPPVPAEEAPLPRAVPDPYDEAFSLYQEGRYGEAVGRLQDLLSDCAREARAAALLGRILADQGRLSEAAAFCRRAVAAERCNPAHYYLLATILEEQGLLQEAASELRNTLYLDQDFVPAHFLLGTLFLRHGNRKESARHFRNAFTLLSAMSSEEPIPGAEGLTAGRLREMIQSNAFEEAK